MRPAAVLVLLLTLAGCASSTPSATADDWAIAGPPRAMPPDIERAEARPGPNGGTLLEPSSVPIESGVAFEFSLGHCGLFSPVDLDGSFWDALDGQSADGRPLDLETHSEVINATSGIIAVVGDEARFVTESGSVIRFERHAGAKEFPGCD